MVWIPMLAIALWLLVFYFIHGGVRTESTTVEPLDKIDADICVIIIFRNEAENLKDCLQSIENTKGCLNPIDVLLVDDHSTDESCAIIDKLKSTCLNLRISVLDNDGYGKKSGLLMAMTKVNNQWLYLTDADCRLKSDTLLRLVRCAQVNEKHVVFAPVMYRNNSFASQLLQYENLNTQCVSEAFLKIGRPLMVNGANFLFRQDVKDDYIRAQRLEYVSGDDVFFAQKLQKNAYAYDFDEMSSVETNAPITWQAFIHQRLRWVSKAPGYQWFGHWGFSAVLLVSSCAFCFTLISWGLNGFRLDVWFLVLASKWLIEYTFHRLWFLKYSFKPTWYDSVLLSVLYPFYTLVLAVLAFFPIPFMWKGRKLTATTQVSAA